MYTLTWDKELTYHDMFNSIKSTQVGSLVGKLRLTKEKDSTETIKGISIEYETRILSLGEMIDNEHYTKIVEPSVIKYMKEHENTYYMGTTFNMKTNTTRVDASVKIMLTTELDGEETTYQVFNLDPTTIFIGQ